MNTQSIPFIILVSLVTGLAAVGLVMLMGGRGDELLRVGTISVMVSTGLQIAQRRKNPV